MSIDTKQKKKWYKTWWGILVIVVALLWGISLIGGSQHNNAKQTTVTNGQSNTTAPKTVENFNIVVTSQIVKKVNGQYRYFFDIRNKDTKPFEGSVTIELYNNQQSSALAGDTFNTNSAIEPNLGTSVYTDAHTGPQSVHGDYGITKFKYTVQKDNKTVKTGEGTITDQLEDTDANGL